MAEVEGVPDEQQRNVESAVSTMAAGAPPDWVSLHAEFAPADASATVITESAADPAPLAIPPEALQDIASHQRRAAQAGEPWHRLIIDCDRTGRLSVRAVSVSRRWAGARYGPAGFAAAMVNILVLVFLSWVTLPMRYQGLVILLPVLIVDALVAFGLTKSHGMAVQVGRGMLIGCAAVSLSILIAGTVFIVAIAIT